MTLSPDLLKSEVAFEREWLLTNGIGGYASGTLGTANTRRYHGLLVAALQAPLGRAVLLSKLEETLQYDGGSEYALSANFYPLTIHPEGHKLLSDWQGGNVCRWTWTLDTGDTLSKTAAMVQGSNATQIVYRYEGSDAPILSLVPLLAGKDYHAELHENPNAPEIEYNAETATLTAKFAPITGVTTEPTELYLAFTDETGEPIAGLTYKPIAAWYRRFEHPRERERGQDYEEDLFAPGTINIPIAKFGTVIVTAGVGTRKIYPVIAEIETPSDFTEALKFAATAFLIDTGTSGRQTIMAGYPWFSDWGRDTMIALPGLCLATKNFPLAESILLSYAKFVSEGMIPNRFPDEGETPDYNTVDATLWFFNAAYETIRQTNGTKLQAQLYPVLAGIVKHHLDGTRYGIHADKEDGLLYAGESGVQLTWMDAKIGDYVVTPRTGKPVEINALWHNALHIMAWLAGRLQLLDDAKLYREMAVRCCESFVGRFRRGDGLGLYDVVDGEPDGWNDDMIRPNQIFAVSLPFAPIEAASELAREIIGVVERELVTPAGLRTLSPSDPAYVGHYGGGIWERDTAYHQGTVWAWLLGAFAEAHWKVFGDKSAARRFLEPLEAQLQTYGMGSLSEVADGDAPHSSNGCIAQAWSVGETLRAWDLLTD